MTKREHDKATKQNWGRRCMASDERRYYRYERMGYNDPLTGDDFIARRAADMRYMRANVDRELATLGRGSKWRAPASYRASVGKPMLASRF